MRFVRSCAAGVVLASAVGSALIAPAASAKVTPEEAARLGGPGYTCFGAEKKGTADGLPDYTGRWVGKWPGMTKDKGYEPGPYAAEKPILTITKANYKEYAGRLTEGEKRLIERYANYRMLVYPSHRDFGFPDWTCDVAKKNAVTSELKDDSRSVTGTGGATAFPIPKSGLEAIWANKTSFRSWTEKAVCDIADVYANGSIAWGRNRFLTMNMMNHPTANPRPSFAEKVQAYFYSGYLLPERDKGFVAVGFAPNGFVTDATQAWQYIPGTRRVRQAPEVGYDYPVPPAGLHTTDEDYGFNGSTERYTWKLVGKKELYLPYHNFRVNDPALKYKELTTPNTLNPDYVRYELHRVYVIEANLREGFRHQYKKRQIYMDEDSQQILWADHYDARDQLWRVAMILYFYSQESSAHHRGVQVFHDLTAGVYEANNLVNERGDDWWRVNTPMSPGLFTPESIARTGR